MTFNSAFITTFSLVSYSARRWNVIYSPRFTSREVIITFYQRTLLGTSANQKRHYLKSYYNKTINDFQFDGYQDLLTQE
jgi:hypothetical protein